MTAFRRSRAAALCGVVCLSASLAAAQDTGERRVPGPTIGSFETLESRSPLDRMKQFLGRVRDTVRRPSGDVPSLPSAGPAMSRAAVPSTGHAGAVPRASEDVRAFDDRAMDHVARPLFAQLPDEEQPLRPQPEFGLQPELGPRPAPVASPTQLKKITEILPYPDYEPDPEIRRDDPCLNLCPRPDDPLCKVYPEGRAPLCPDELLLGTDVWFPRVIEPSVFTWAASDLYHYPLYFEDPPLERYGHTHGCVQPFVSVARFNVQLLGLPYQMTIDPICKKMYTLGWYRPGECAPKLHYQIPWHHQAAINQALVTVGMFYLIP